jgi:FHA domain
VNELQVSCEGRRYTFAPGATVRIGRSSDNDVVISDPTVSRQHAQLVWGPAGWVFQGQGRAGTFLRGSAVTTLLLREPVELSLASPQGPVLRLEPSPAGPPPTQTATGVMDQAAALPGTPIQAAPPRSSAGFGGRRCSVASP